MARVLVYYGTSEGHTTKIAHHIADVVRKEGHQVDVVHGGLVPEGTDPSRYDGIIIGASVHEGRHQKYVHEFIADNRVLLDRIPSAFFQTSLASAMTDAVSRAEAEEYVARLVEHTGWHPKQVGLFAGALLYTQYSFLKRFIMKAITKRAGGDTDTSRDFEYTDWNGVTRFAEEVARRLRVATARPQPRA